MKKLFLWTVAIACGLLLFGYTLNKKIEGLQEQVKVQKAKSLMTLAQETGSNRFWWRNGLTGGGNALDGIAHGSLTDGDAAFVVMIDGGSSCIWAYVYDPDAANTTSSPDWIAPTSGGGAWQQANMNIPMFVSEATDGYRLVNVYNTVKNVGI